ncbi:MAG: nucleotidyltransferase domain-containing protein, partial [Acetatifactor sp.]|nr:nucleotidyltransferase domain-containing protein [Acetatifactor sp.]
MKLFYGDLLDSITLAAKDILGEALTGVYLHGSLAMGCFNPEKSDIDLILVINREMTDRQKRQFMETVVELNAQAPKKGLELSVVEEDVCRHFVYPTPFELHFSLTHLKWWQEDPEGYIQRMKGTDQDLAAHFTILYHRGKTLFGKEIKEVF